MIEEMGWLTEESRGAFEEEALHARTHARHRQTDTHTYTVWQDDAAAVQRQTAARDTDTDATDAADADAADADATDATTVSAADAADADARACAATAANTASATTTRAAGTGTSAGAASRPTVPAAATASYETSPPEAPDPVEACQDGPAVCGGQGRALPGLVDTATVQAQLVAFGRERREHAEGSRSRGVAGRGVVAAPVGGGVPGAVHQRVVQA